ncbi:VOC family protein [Zhouia amylolytica]|uniref:VOC family protein n=1 Tax=Zhouia amylolytica TaxID=376730 RepID=UPI0020CEED19|nr:VOC family protein [Zhouia amylolytica]MCQ0109995.1 VOC family protein [Zhouia amylolytica]
MKLKPHNSKDFTFNKDHDAIQVKNLRVSAAFYEKVFGLKEIYNAGLGANFKWYQLNDKVQIHLIESEEDFKPHKGVHMALNVNNLEGFMKFLNAEKIHFENWPGEMNTTNTRPDGIKQIYIKDPDGYWIEVNDNRL